MKIFSSIQDWTDHYYEIEEVISGELPLRETLDPLSSISFPVVIKDVLPNPLGAMAFFTKNVSCSIESPGKFHFDSDKFHLGKYSDFFLFVEPCIKWILDHRYPLSPRFISFDIDPETFYCVDQLNRIRSSLKTDGSSYNLALLFHVLLGPLQEYLNEKIAFTGVLNEANGQFFVAKVNNIKEKLIAAAGYQIDKFFIPFQNIGEITTTIKENLAFDIVPVNTPEEVLESLFGESWFKTPIFRKIYDLKFQYQQYLLNSDLVRIKRIVSWGEKDKYSDISNYVKVQIIEKEDLDKKVKTDTSQESFSGDIFSKYDEREQSKKESPPVLPSAILESIGEKNKNVTIFGEAGAGKSTILRKFLYQLCNEEINQTKDFIPVFIELSHAFFGDEKDLRRSLVHTLLDGKQPGISISSECSIFRDYLLENISKGRDRLLFLLDGYDEIDENVALFSVNIKSLKNVIITSRYKAGTSGLSDETYEVLPLDENAVHQYLTRNISDERKREAAIDLIDRHSVSIGKHLFSNPLIMSILTFIINENPFNLDIPSLTKSQIIDIACKTLVRKAREHYTLDKTPYDNLKFHDKCTRVFMNSLLPKIAFDSFHKSSYEKTEVISIILPLCRKDIEEHKDLTEFISDLPTKIGILEEFQLWAWEGTKTYYRFSHQVFHEFFAAKYVVDEFSSNELKFREFINEYKYDDRYKMVFIFVAGLLDMSNECQNTIKIFFDTCRKDQIDIVGSYNNILTAMCLCETKNVNVKIVEDIWDDLFSFFSISELQTMLRKTSFQSTLVELASIRPPTSFAYKRLSRYWRNSPATMDRNIKFILDIAAESSGKALADSITFRDLDWTGSEEEWALKDIGRGILAEALLDCLRDENSTVRNSAVRALFAAGPGSSAETLEYFLRDENPTVRASAVRAIGAIGAESSVEILVNCLKDEDPIVRGFTVWSLGRIGAESSVEILVNCLKDEDPIVRGFAVWAIERIDAESSAEALIDCLKDENSIVRNSAAELLGAIRPASSAEAIVDCLRDKNPIVRVFAAWILERIGSESSAEALIACLKDEHLIVRNSAIKALVAIGPESFAETLMGSLKDENPNLRESAVRALGAIGADSSTEALKDCLRDGDPNVRYSTVWALGKINGERSTEALVDCLRGRNPSVRRFALWVINYFDTVSSVESLEDCLRDKDPRVRKAVIDALERIDGEKSTEALVNCLRDEDPTVRKAAINALLVIGAKSSSESLRDCLRDEDLDVRKAAIDVLIRIDGEKSTEALVDCLRDEDPTVRKAAAHALGEIGVESSTEALKNCLKDENPTVRASAVRALMFIGGERSTEALVDCLRHEDPRVREAAVHALGKIDAENSTEVLKNSLKDENPTVRASAVRALMFIGGERSTKALVDCLRDEDPTVREAAVHALGENDVESSTEALKNCLKDENPTVRASAVEALVRIDTGSMRDALFLRQLASFEGLDQKSIIEILDIISSRNGMGKSAEIMYENYVPTGYIRKLFLALSIPVFFKGGKYYYYNQFEHRECMLPSKLGNELLSFHDLPFILQEYWRDCRDRKDLENDMAIIPF